MKLKTKIKRIENNKRFLGGYIALFLFIILALFVYSFKNNVAGRAFCFGDCGSSFCALGDNFGVCGFVLLGLVVLFGILVFLILRNKKR